MHLNYLSTILMIKSLSFISKGLWYKKNQYSYPSGNKKCTVSSKVYDLEQHLFGRTAVTGDERQCTGTFCLKIFQEWLPLSF